MSDAGLECIPDTSSAGAVSSAVRQIPPRREGEEEYVYGCHVFLIEIDGRRGQYLDVNEEIALDIVGSISTWNGHAFRAVMHPRHVSFRDGDETLPGIRKVVCTRREVDEARERLRQAGLRIIGESLY